MYFMIVSPKRIASWPLVIVFKIMLKCTRCDAFRIHHKKIRFDVEFDLTTKPKIYVYIYK